MFKFMNAGAVELRAAVASCRAAFLGVAVFSGLINLLALTSSIYMLQLYDRVIPSHSVPTLVGLTILMLLLFAGYGVLDTVRSRVMSHIGLRIDRALRARVFELVLLLPLRAKSSDSLQPVRDLDQVRGFLTGAGPIALFDLPWMPFYLGLVFLLHPWLGLLGTIGAATLLVLTILTEVRSRAPTKSASTSAAARLLFGEAARRNAEVIRALGMGPHISAIWSAHNEKYLTDQVGASDVAVTYGTLSKVLRLILQSAVLGLGAYLVIMGQVTGGVMIAASILVSRALAPIEIAIANWRGFLSSRQSAERLSKLLQSLPIRPEAIVLPTPARTFTVEGLWIAAPGHQKPIVENASFLLRAGDGLGVIGPSASGKSTLARALVGAWLPVRGNIRLDGGALDQWSPAALGVNIGYLPQDIELFDSSVAQNIARFDKNAPATAIIAAAQKAGAHEMILQLPEGYETRIGDGGTALSAGQRQRVALARALYDDPFLVVLDEPSSNLDADGDAALMRAIASVRQRGGIVIIVTHRPAALSGLDQLLVMSGGQVQAFGPKDEVLRKVVPMPAATGQSTSGRLKVVTEGGQEAG
jgi:ATP-binding cassette, subfamily C, type I secretion system permease/ATPase